MHIVLASSSIYRKALLKRLHLEFECATPDIDETPQRGESPQALVERLALAKAKAVARQYKNALIIGSDQVAVLDDEIIGKPGSLARAEAQLRQASGKSMQLLTGLCLYNSKDQSYQLDSIPFEVQFRPLSPQQIHKYVALEQPLDCAGSFKWERLGIALFARMQGDDVTALEGLPLIRLVDMLAQAGAPVL